MTISDKTRKRLWAYSGNQCAYCKRKLIEVSDGNVNDDSVLGDECHIVAQSSDGPRGNSSLPLNERDNYDNLILLCKTHHKLVDDQPNKYTVEVLQDMKRKHEKLVSERLNPKAQTSNKVKEPFAVYRVRTGQQLLEAVGGTYAYYFRNDNIESDFDVELVGDFLQNLQDCLDLWDELDSKARVAAQFDMSQQIQNLDTNGFLVYACQRRENIRSGDYKDNWPVAYVNVLHKNNPMVVRKNEQVTTASTNDEPDNFADFILAVHT